jgi:hypothetical protein
VAGQVDLKRFETRDEVRVFEKGRLAVIRLGGMVLGRAEYEPGWKWSVDVGPSLGASLCTVEHVGIVLGGTATVAFEDGTVGNRPYVSLHLMGADSYARKQP